MAGELPVRAKAAKLKEPPAEKAFIAAKAHDFQPSLVIYKPNEST
jgi:hypothetical protein